jgi:hypothetical protein
VNYFLDATFLRIFLSSLTFIVLILCIFHADKIPKMMGIVLLGLSLLIGVVNETSILSILNGFQKNLPILTLILLAPFITIPLKMSGYLHSTFYLMEELKKKPNKAFFGLSGFIFVISPILNIGAVRITHEIIKELDFKQTFLAKTYVIGYTTALVWSPYFASVAMVLHLMKVEMSSYILIGFIFALLQFLLGNLLFRLRTSNKKEIQRSTDNATGHLEDIQSYPNHLAGHYRNIIKLFFMIITVISLLIVLEYITRLPMLLLVGLSALVIPIIWGVISKKTRPTLGEMKDFIFHLDQASNEIVLFISAGLFASVLVNSPASNVFDQLFLSTASISSLLFITLVVFLVVFLTFIGIHQIIVVPLLVIQVDPELIGLSPLLLSFVFIMAWCVSIALTPISATNMLVSNLLKEKWWKVGIKWNGLYVLSVYIAGIIVFCVLKFFHI